MTTKTISHIANKNERKNGNGEKGDDLIIQEGLDLFFPFDGLLLDLITKEKYNNNL